MWKESKWIFLDRINNQYPFLDSIQTVKRTKTDIVHKSSQEVLIILWFLWAWKTTLIESLVPYLESQWKKTKIIINDIGNINVDSKRLNENWLNTIALTQWCICCSDIWSLAQELEKLKETWEMIIIEPTWLATAEDIKSLTKSFGMQTKVITLINTNDYLDTQEDPHKESTIRKQLTIADSVWLTRTTNKSNVQQVRKDLLSILRPEIDILQVPYQTTEENFWNENTKPEIKDFWEKIQKNKQYEWFFPILKKRNSSTQWIHKKEHHHWNWEVISFIWKDIPKDFWEEELNLLVKTLGNNLYRAKWVISWRQFNYVQSDQKLNRWKFVNTQSYMNIITKKSLDINLNSMCIEHCESKNSNSQSSQQTSIPNNWNIAINIAQDKIKTLVDQYHEYMNMYNHKNKLLKENESNFDENTAKEITDLEFKMQKLWDEMKYDNPLIRLEYKRLAYANEWEKKVTTISELRKHCERPTYICHKRLDFLNKHLKQKFNIDFFDDQNTAPNSSLENIDLERKEIQELCWDEVFMKEWLKYEYFTDNWKTAKRENYIK